MIQFICPQTRYGMCDGNLVLVKTRSELPRRALLAPRNHFFEVIAGEAL